MIIALACSRDAGLRRQWLQELKEITAKESEEEWNFTACATPGACDEFLRERSVVDVVCCDVTAPEFLEWLLSFRGEHRETRVMLAAGPEMNPMCYLCPQIMAASLLLKPCPQAQLQRVVREFVEAFLAARQGDRSCLTIRSGEGSVRIPYDSIYYLEAREKKLFVRLRREEYGFYGVLERLEETLPPYFIRTHRSFLVNRKKIETVLLREATVQLCDGFAVPLSRSCRAKLREMDL